MHFIDIGRTPVLRFSIGGNRTAEYEKSHTVALPSVKKKGPLSSAQYHKRNP